MATWYSKFSHLFKIVIKDINSIQREKNHNHLLPSFVNFSSRDTSLFILYKTYENSWNTFILSESVNVLQCGWKCAIKIEILYALLMNYESIFLNSEMEIPSLLLLLKNETNRGSQH